MVINSQAKGKRAERDLANWWKENGFPDAARAVKTGDRFTHDGGDLILENAAADFRLVVEVKHHAGGLSVLQVSQFGVKLLEQVRHSRGDMGVLIERRDAVADPGKWWAHVSAPVFAQLVIGYPDFICHFDTVWVPVRCSVAYFAELLRNAGLARPGTGVPASAVSGAARAAGLVTETVDNLMKTNGGT